MWSYYIHQDIRNSSITDKPNFASCLPQNRFSSSRIEEYMATRDSEQPTHSNWDLENEQATRDDVPLPTVSNIWDPYQTNNELLTKDEDHTDFYGVLLLPLTTTSQTISTPDIPLASSATQLADSSLRQLHL